MRFFLVVMILYLRDKVPIFLPINGIYLSIYYTMLQPYRVQFIYRSLPLLHTCRHCKRGTTADLIWAALLCWLLWIWREGRQTTVQLYSTFMHSPKPRLQSHTVHCSIKVYLFPSLSLSVLVVAMELHQHFVLFSHCRRRKMKNEPSFTWSVLSLLLSYLLLDIVLVTCEGQTLKNIQTEDKIRYSR